MKTTSPMACLDECYVKCRRMDHLVSLPVCLHFLMHLGQITKKSIRIQNLYHLPSALLAACVPTSMPSALISFLFPTKHVYNKYVTF